MRKIFIITTLLFILLASPIAAQSVLESNNFKIIDPTIDSGGGVSEGSGDFDLLSSIGNPTADARLESSSYALGSGFPSGIQANVPLVKCAETDTNDTTTECLNFPNSNGAVGECGNPGCYDRAKIEIDHQSNPVDTLYLISVLDKKTNIQYYVTSSHTLSAAVPTVSNNYMTICELEGRDIRSGSGCAISSDSGWNETLQRYNVYGLNPGTEYDIRVRAMSGDFTETQYSPIKTIKTELPMLSFDIDIDGIGGFATESTPPHRIGLGTLLDTAAVTASDRIWLDINTNVIEGTRVFVKGSNNGLSNGTTVIPSETEDLATDPNNNGGYGLKLGTSAQTNLGPLVSTSIYSTAGADEVGALTTTNAQVLETNMTGNNQGPIVNGRASIAVKARKTAGTPAGLYSDIITFTMIMNL